MLISTAHIARGRALANAQMIDRGRVTREAEPDDPDYIEPAMDPVTLQYTAAPRVVVYEGRCRVQVRSDINSNAVEAIVGDHEGTYRTSTAQFPMEPVGDPGDIGHPGNVRPNYELEILTSPLDPLRVGTILNLQAEPKAKTMASHRRFRAREVLS